MYILRLAPLSLKVGGLQFIFLCIIIVLIVDFKL